jgi:hypothetical protein
MNSPADGSCLFASWLSKLLDAHTRDVTTNMCMHVQTELMDHLLKNCDMPLVSEFPYFPWGKSAMFQAEDIKRQMRMITGSIQSVADYAHCMRNNRHVYGDNLEVTFFASKYSLNVVVLTANPHDCQTFKFLEFGCG